MYKTGLSDEQLSMASGGANITLNDEQQAKIRDSLASKDAQIRALEEELKEYKRRTVIAEVHNDIYNTNREVKKDSATMTQIGKDTGVIK